MTGTNDPTGSRGSPRSAAAGLEVEHLTVRYGGLLAVDDVCLQAPTGQITGLIGPNGAGKTTTFNACSGLLRPTDGVVRLDGRDVTHLSPPARAQLGLGRTFQRMELFDTLTAVGNVALGREAMLAGANPLRHLRASRAERKVVADAAEDAMARCGIEGLRARRVADLSTGQRRLVELARAVASGATVLLLDEPSSGLDHDETDAFGGILCDLVAEWGIGILLVEHDMALVMSVCHWIHVLDFGKPLFEGTPRDVSGSEVVRSAYLGSEAEVGVG
jgi:ABC-type branched-subunit amino acid transport system ATPase component